MHPLPFYSRHLCRIKDQEISPNNLHLSEAMFKGQLRGYRAISETGNKELGCFRNSLKEGGRMKNSTSRVPHLFQLASRTAKTPTERWDLAQKKQKPPACKILLSC